MTEPGRDDPARKASSGRARQRARRRKPVAPRGIRELPAAERPRERLALRGPGGLTAAELIALIWGSGSRGVSAVDLAEEALGSS